MSKADKFNHLHSLLKGSSETLSLTDSNYDSAVEILHERFGNPQQIISGYMDELLKIPNCTKTDHPNTLQFIYDKLNVHVRGLSSLGVDSEQYEIPVIMSKFLQNLRLRMAREIKSSV